LFKIPIERTHFGQEVKYMMARHELPQPNLNSVLGLLDIQVNQIDPQMLPVMQNNLNNMYSPDYQLNSILIKTTNKQNITKDLDHLYIIDSEWGVTSHLFDLMIYALKHESFSVMTEKDI